jgi:dynein heavy chain 1
MYGGKIDSEADYTILQSLVNNFLTPAAFDADHNIVRGLRPEGAADAGTLILPEGTQWKDFSDWVQALPEREPPTYLGLPADAERLLLVGQAKRMMEDLRRIGGILDA